MKTLSKTQLAANLKHEDECARVGGKTPSTYIVAADVVKELELILVVFSDKSIGTLDFTKLRKSNVEPDLDKVQVIDHGLTLALGDYEIGSEVFLLNVTPIFPDGE